LLWTIQIPDDSVEINLNTGQATLELHNVCRVFDIFTVPNSFDPLHALGLVSAVIQSLRIRWSGIAKQWSFSNGSTFRGNFIQSVRAPIELTVTTPPTKPPFTPIAQDGFRFVADPTTTTTLFAQIGRETNGALF
jgi:hypothetical protein